MADVHHYTKAVDFDMCTAGHLQDPNTGLLKGDDGVVHSSEGDEKLEGQEMPG